MGEDATTFALIKRYEELETLYGDGPSGNFLSGWQCVNPWSETVQKRIDDVRLTIDGSKYHYFDDDKMVERGLSDLHQDVDGVVPQSVLCGEGASSLIFTFCAWLRQMSVSEVFYVPPLYFTFHYALRLFGIRARPIAGKHSFEAEVVWNLPCVAVVLLVCDPIWYAGMPLDEAQVARLIDWQRKTGSTIIVDGSFQYMRWDGTSHEPTAHLDPDRTIRLVCPTKALAVHGYRFAYATMPALWRKELSVMHSNGYGSVAADNIAFAKAAVSLLREGHVRASLMKLASSRHRTFRASGTIAADWQPGCGYFIFERITSSLPADAPLMDGSFFEQRRYEDHVRINLLSPSIDILR
jgi:histidinol-phosphate/aromatic aminotransferase/cobyric acid decarboxylase-like protein